MGATRNVLVVDDHPLVLESITALLESHGFTVVGRAVTLSDALEFLAKNQVDVVLLGLRLPDAGTLPFLRDIRTTHPEAIVVVFFGSGEEAELNAAFGEGAVVYVRDTAEPDDLVTALRQVFKRSVFFRPEGEQRMRQDKAATPVLLTPREIEILRLIAAGESSAEIARGLWVAEPTVKFHLANIYRKIGVSNRTEAARYAFVHGLLADDEADEIGA